MRTHLHIYVNKLLFTLKYKFSIKFQFLGNNHNKSTKEFTNILHLAISSKEVRISDNNKNFSYIDVNAQENKLTDLFKDMNVNDGVYQGSFQDLLDIIGENE